MITDRDREIINYIYKIGFATIEQIATMFFTDQKSGYDLARRRLKAIRNQSEYLKSLKNSETNQLIYFPCDSNRKRISMHDLKVIDYLCELKKLGCEINEIIIEPNFLDIIPDALVTFVFDGFKYYQLIEMQLRHDYVDLDRFNKEGVVAEILKKTNNVLPTLIIIQNTNKDYSEANKTQLDIKQLKLDMVDVAKVLI